MRGANVVLTEAHYKGQTVDEDFIVYLNDETAYRKWKDGDTSIPLTEFVATFEIFVTHKHGSQGEKNAASNATLDEEFGSHKDIEVVEKLLSANESNGTLRIKQSQNKERHGDKNVADGPRVAH